MQINKLNTGLYFNGMLSPKTIKLASDTMGDEGAKLAKNFRAGKNKFDKISILYDEKPKRTMYHGQVLDTDTYMEVRNLRSKKPPVRAFLTKGKLAFGEQMLDLIANKMKLIDNLRGI